MAKKKLADFSRTAEANKTRIATGLAETETEGTTVEAAIVEVEEQVTYCREEIAGAETYTKFYASVLAKGKKNKVCIGCDRKLLPNDMNDFEAYVSSPLPSFPGSLLTLLPSHSAKGSRTNSRLSSRPTRRRSSNGRSS